MADKKPAPAETKAVRAPQRVTLTHKDYPDSPATPLRKDMQAWLDLGWVEEKP